MIFVNYDLVGSHKIWPQYCSGPWVSRDVIIHLCVYLVNSYIYSYMCYDVKPGWSIKYIGASPLCCNVLYKWRPRLNIYLPTPVTWRKQDFCFEMHILIPLWYSPQRRLSVSMTWHSGWLAWTPSTFETLRCKTLSSREWECERELPGNTCDPFHRSPVILELQSLNVSIQ